MVRLWAQTTGDMAAQYTRQLTLVDTGPSNVEIPITPTQGLITPIQWSQEAWDELYVVEALLQAQCEITQAKKVSAIAGKRQALVNFPTFSRGEGRGGAVKVLADRQLGLRLLEYVDGKPLTAAIKALIAIDQLCTVGRALDKTERLRTRVYHLGTAVFCTKKFWESAQNMPSCTAEQEKATTEPF